jgi:putative ABC transport system permease protein
MKLLGTNNVIIEPVVEQQEGQIQDNSTSSGLEQQRYSPGLTLDDMQSIQELVPFVENVSPEIVFDTYFVRDGRMRSGKLVGVNQQYFDINNFAFEEGGAFTALHIDNSEPVCVIGHDVKTRFFAGQSPIGKKIKTGDLWLTVIGVLEEREMSTENIENLGIRNYNLDIYTPATTVLLRFKNRALITQQDIQAAAANSRQIGPFFISPNDSDEAPPSTPENYHQLDKLIVQVSDTR